MQDIHSARDALVRAVAFYEDAVRSRADVRAALMEAIEVLSLARRKLDPNGSCSCIHRLGTHTRGGKCRFPDCECEEFEPAEIEGEERR